MRNALRIVLWGVCGLVVLSGVAHAEVQAGAAYEPFLLPKHVPLAGYSRRGGKPSQGVHDPVGVRAIVLSDATTTVALISCDLLIIDEHLFGEVERQLRSAGWPPSLQVMLAATHTHSGPGAYGPKFLEKLSMGHYDSQVCAAIAQAIVRAVGRAAQARAPVAMKYGSMETEGLVRNRISEDGPVDAQVVVLGFYHPPARQPFAIVVDFAAHPTTLGAWNRLLSADYPGVLVRELERRFPQATAVFLAGAVGDQGPVKSGNQFERAEWFGRALADAASRFVEQADPMVPPEVRAVQERVVLPPAQVRLGHLMFPRWLGRSLVDDDATLSVIRVVTTAFLGAPCDLTAELGERLKSTARSYGLNPVIVGFTNDYIGYCVSESLYRAHQYESSMAFNGPKAGELIVDRLSRLLKDISHGT